MVKQIIKEAMEKNPIGLKEAVEAELRERLGVALQERGKPKIACMKCDEVSTQAAWEKNGGFCPKCKVSSQGVAESLEESVKVRESFDLSDLTLEELEDFVESVEFDQLDEISKKTLGSYIKKASDDMANNAYALGDRSPLRPAGSWDKAFKRKKGIEKATDRLTKEEASPKWKVKIGNKTYVVTAKNTFEANRKAEAKAKKEGNTGVSTGKIEKV